MTGEFVGIALASIISHRLERARKVIIREKMQGLVLKMDIILLTCIRLFEPAQS